MNTVEKKAYSRQEFADAYGVSLSTVKNLLRDGEITSRWSGRKRLIDVEEAERWFKALPADRDN